MDDSQLLPFDPAIWAEAAGTSKGRIPGVGSTVRSYEFLGYTSPSIPTSRFSCAGSMTEQDINARVQANIQERMSTIAEEVSQNFETQLHDVQAQLEIVQTQLRQEREESERMLRQEREESQRIIRQEREESQRTMAEMMERMFRDRDASTPSTRLPPSPQAFPPTAPP